MWIQNHPDTFLLDSMNTIHLQLGYPTALSPTQPSLLSAPSAETKPAQLTLPPQRTRPPSPSPTQTQPVGHGTSSSSPKTASTTPLGQTTVPSPEHTDNTHRLQPHQQVLSPAHSAPTQLPPTTPCY
jgi:hypothetical protein